MKYLPCILVLLSFGAAAADSSQAGPPPGVAPAPAAEAAAPLSDDEALAQQLVHCGVIAQKLGRGDYKTAGWSVSYNGAAAALTSAAFVAAQLLAQAGSADGLPQADLENGAAQCQLMMFTSMDRIGAAMKRRQGGAAQQ